MPCTARTSCGHPYTFVLLKDRSIGKFQTTLAGLPAGTDANCVTPFSVPATTCQFEMSIPRKPHKTARTGSPRMKKHVNRQRLPASRSRGALAKCNTNCPQWGRTPTQSGCDEHPKVSLKFCQTTKKTCKPFGFRCEDGTLQNFAGICTWPIAWSSNDDGSAGFLSPIAKDVRSQFKLYQKKFSRKKKEKIILP